MDEHAHYDTTRDEVFDLFQGTQFVIYVLHYAWEKINLSYHETTVAHVQCLPSYEFRGYSHLK